MPMPTLVPTIISRGCILAEDVINLRGDVEIDDNNDSALVNMHVDVNIASSMFGENFGHGGMCRR